MTADTRTITVEQFVEAMRREIPKMTGLTPREWLWIEDGLSRLAALPADDDADLPRLAPATVAYDRGVIAGIVIGREKRDDAIRLLRDLVEAYGESPYIDFAAARRFLAEVEG